MVYKSIFIFVLLISFSITSCSFHQEKEMLFGQNNSIWTESIYLRGYRPSTKEKLTINHIEDYANNLERNNIKYAYLFAGPFQEDGKLPGYSFSEIAQESVSILKKYYPEIVILPWIGGIQNKTVYLNDSVWAKNALESTVKLVNTLGVAGVHVDFEFILSGDPYLDTTIKKERPGDLEEYGQNVNTFHKDLRKLMPDAYISSVVAATSRDIVPWKRKTSMTELKNLTQYIDQISFLFYDTSIDDQTVFDKSCQELLSDIKELRTFSPEVQYLVAIGTFVNRPELHKYRNLEIESIPNTLQTIKNTSWKLDSLNKIVDGIAIFCDWQTDKLEWDQFRNHWIN